jgi:hypothetical protein
MAGSPTREVRLPSPPGGATRWVVVAAVVALAVVTVVTASSPVDVLSQPPRGSASSVLLETPPTVATVTTTPRPSEMPDLSSLPSLPPLLLTFIEIVVGVFLLWALIYLLRFAWRSVPRLRTRTVPRPALQSLPPLPDELVESAERRAALLREGSPRNAFVACWIDLEDSATAAGLPREPYETSAEYTVRVLHTWDIAPDALGGLAELYREARYSRHPLTEQHRAQAIARLQVLHDDLRRVAEESAALPGGHRHRCGR